MFPRAVIAWPDASVATPRARRAPMTIELEVNGKRAAIGADPTTPLLWVLREELRLVGTKYGCGAAQCGACTVHVDGRAARSCVLPLSACTGKKITTVEGLQGPVAAAVKDAWVAIDVPQCGYCQTSQVMSACVLLAETATPSDDDIDAAMAGNVCRCATYVRIRQAIHDAAKVIGGGR